MQYNDLISRAELIKRIDKCVEANYVVTDQLMTIHDIKALISILPTVDAAPVRRGYWIDRDGQYECSECHNIACCKGNYCPDCGAKQDVDGTRMNNGGELVNQKKYCPDCGAKMDAPTCGPDYCKIGDGDDE